MNKLREIIGGPDGEKFERDGTVFCATTGTAVMRVYPGMGFAADSLATWWNLAPEILDVIDAARELYECRDSEGACECQNCRTLAAVRALDTKTRGVTT